DLPGGDIILDGEEARFGLGDQIDDRHIAHLAQHAAIGGTVAVIAHHEEMTGGHDIFRRVVERRVIGNFLDYMAGAFREGFAIDGDLARIAIAVGIHGLADFLALDHDAVDVKAPFPDLNYVTGHAHDALDIFH